MLVALYGSIVSETLAKFKGTDHQLMVTDHPVEAQTLAALTELEIPFTVCRAEWRNLDHPRSRKGSRISNITGQPEDFNSNGGFVRDAIMAARADAIVLGSGINANRETLIRTEAGDRPIRTVAPPVTRIPPKAVEAELTKLFGKVK